MHLGEASIQEFGGAQDLSRSACPSRRAATPPRTASRPRSSTRSASRLSGRARSTRSIPCRARSARSSPTTAPSRSLWRCSGSRSTSGSASNGSSASGALLTLAHDVAMTLGFFAFTRLQVDLNVVAAFLTIVGYSLNDTVVIYDRIRENLRKYRKMAILPLLNLSLNETLARTVVTSLTVLHRARRADADRPRSDLRPRHRDLPRRRHRHLFVDLHFVAGAGLARGQARQLPQDRRQGGAPSRRPPDLVQQRPSFRQSMPALGLPRPPR